jgi:hypothetical protein
VPLSSADDISRNNINGRRESPRILSTKTRCRPDNHSACNRIPQVPRPSSNESKGTMIAPGYKHVFLSRQSCIKALEPDLALRRNHARLNWAMSICCGCAGGPKIQFGLVALASSKSWIGRVVSFAAGGGQCLRNPAVADRCSIVP